MKLSWKLSWKFWKINKRLRLTFFFEISRSFLLFLKVFWGLWHKAWSNLRSLIPQPHLDFHNELKMFNAFTTTSILFVRIMHIFSRFHVSKKHIFSKKGTQNIVPPTFVNPALFKLHKMFENSQLPRCSAIAIWKRRVCVLCITRCFFLFLKSFVLNFSLKNPIAIFFYKYSWKSSKFFIFFTVFIVKMAKVFSKVAKRFVKWFAAKKKL